MPTTETTLKDTAITTLLAIRDTAAADLAVMPAHKEGSEWAADRYRDVAWANRQLARLEAEKAAADPYEGLSYNDRTEVENADYLWNESQRAIEEARIAKEARERPLTIDDPEMPF